jgi:hypothetical protein
MTQEEEKLLLIDLAARVPHGVMVEQTLFPPTIADKEQRLKSVQANNCVKLYWNKYNIDDFVPIHCIKPYLRPMSSMTEEEREEFYKECEKDYKIAVNEANRSYKSKFDEYAPLLSSYNKHDWLNSHYFDYRGLIPKGLALEAPEDMYKTE